MEVFILSHFFPLSFLICVDQESFSTAVSWYFSIRSMYLAQVHTWDEFEVFDSKSLGSNFPYKYFCPHWAISYFMLSNLNLPWIYQCKSQSVYSELHGCLRFAFLLSFLIDLFNQETYHICMCPRVFFLHCL